jgi:putative membrane protein
MYTKKFIDPGIVWYFSWRMLLSSAALSTGVYLLHHNFHVDGAVLPFLPIATVGTAVAFYVGFKNNSSYDRLWEGRKIWGEITNSSRAVASYVLAAGGTKIDSTDMRHFIYRQIAFANMLRLQLRRKNLWHDGDEYTRMSKECFRNESFEVEAAEVLGRLCPADSSADLLVMRNTSSHLAHRQMQDITRFKANGWIDDFEASDLMRMVNELFVHQGKAERIKTFPFPRQYAFFSETFVYVFIVLLPFGLVGEFAKLGSDREWLVIPFSVLISWIFFTMEKVGDTSENPFEASLNDVPMSAICRNIEIDLRSMLLEDDLPDPLSPVDHILM